MSEELAKCPDCGGGCHKPEPGEGVWIECRSCGYTVIADTKEFAIAHHNRLTGKCRIKFGPYMDYVAWKAQCGKVHLMGGALPKYCDNCGKQIEEVKE